MKLSELRPPAGAKRKRKRVGRGPGSGHGKTSTRGNKGQLARSGGKSKPYREGGQMPLQRRLPKRGFAAFDKKVFQVVNLCDFSRLKTPQVVNPLALQNAGLIDRANYPVKILGTGQAPEGLTVEAHAFSRSAKEKIIAKGGRVLLLNA